MNRSFLKKAIFLALVSSLLFSCASLAQESSLYVKKVENLPEDFILGMDASSVIAQEQSGVRYYDFDGNERDVFSVLREQGINYIRVRVWNHPYDSLGHGYGGGNSDIEKCVEIGRRATENGMKLLVDFHYSDFWADPGKQMVPLAWKGMTIEEKTEALYQYTRECLEMLKAENIDVGMVQIGNETNGAMCGEKIWFNIQYLMQAGAKATREVYPEALVALHFANPEKEGSYENYAKKLDYYQVDYDVFASSYYPYWHGTLDHLAGVLNTISATYGKKVMVVETSYAYTGEDTDFFGNTVSDGGAIEKPWPFTVQGQANAVREVIDTVANKMTDGIGVCYWEGTWNSVGSESWEENHVLWETYGSGWATSYARAYDPADAGKYYGGCAVDNQAFFDAAGRPLESLKVFSLVREGNQIEVRADAIEDVSLIADINAPLVLPETVNAVMTDGSKKELPVVWSLTEADDLLMHSNGVQKYTVLGTAGGMEAKCFVSMVEYNYLTDYSFEEGGKDWVFTDLKKADELYVEEKKSDSLTGTKHAHFWSGAKDSVEFTLEQTRNDISEGKYKFTISIMGGDGGKTEIYAYAKVNGEVRATAPLGISSYGNWDTAVVENIVVKAGDTVTVGIYVKCQGSGNGAWGKIDDALLNSVK